ncbi:MAG: redoxin domain-containing protein [Bacteroidales bacterium]
MQNILSPMLPTLKRYKTRILLSALILVVVLAGCHQQESTQVSSIMGMIEGSGRKSVRLSELDARALIPIDSVIPGNDGSFVFALEVKEPSFYQLSTSTSDPLTLVVKPGDKIMVEGKADSILWAKISGSQESLLLQEYLRVSRQRLDTAERLVKHLANNSNTLNFKALRDSVSRALENLFQRQRNFTLRFVEAHPGTLAGLIAINQPFGRRTVLDPISDRKIFIQFDSSLRKNYPQGKHALFFHQRMAELNKAEAIKKLRIENLKPGKPLPTFRIPTLDEGQWVTPEALKGSPLILVFWSPAEGKQVKKLIALKKALGSKKMGVQVLAIAFDTQAIRWQNAVKNAGLQTWVHGSDLKGTASPLYELFLPDAQPLPRFVLTDAEGMIRKITDNPQEIIQALLND